MSMTPPLSRLISSGGIGPASQMSELSQSTRNNGGDMFKLGYRTRRRLLRGIFVSLLSLEVARMRSTTVCKMSLFSTGR